MANRVAIIGTGWVGSSVAISTLHAGVASELLLNDFRTDVAEGEAMDLAHGASFYPTARVRAVPIEETVDADAVVVTAGRGSGPEQSRLDLLQTNAKIIRDIGGQLAGCRGNVVVVTNPVDLMTQVMQQASGLPAHRVLGTGTMLDTARLRHALARELNLNPRSVHAQVVGEHGDSEVVLWSGVQVGGTRLRDWPDWNRERETAIAEEVRTAAYEIIRRKGSTNHAIGLATAALLRWMLRGDRRVLTVSRVQSGAMGVDDIAISLPAIVGPDGAEQVLEPEMNDEERAGFLHSVDVLRKAAADAGLGM